MIKAATCQELLDKVMETPQLTEVLKMVLEEDGTTMESKDFFQLLEDDTCLMVLDFGKSWTPEGMGAVKWPRPGEHQAQKGHHPHHLQHIEAKPLELLWQPNIKATFYKLYPMSCDSQGPGLKKVLSGLLQLNLHVAARPGPNVAGNFLHPSPCSRGG